MSDRVRRVSLGVVAAVLALAAPLSLTAFWLQTGLFAMAAPGGGIILILSWLAFAAAAAFRRP